MRSMTIVRRVPTRVGSGLRGRAGRRPTARRTLSLVVVMAGGNPTRFAHNGPDEAARPPRRGPRHRGPARCMCRGRAERPRRSPTTAAPEPYGGGLAARPSRPARPRRAPSAASPGRRRRSPTSHRRSPSRSTQVGALRQPIGIATAPGGWLLVNERAGRVVALTPGSGRRRGARPHRPRPGGGERGLLGLVLHPRWPDVPACLRALQRPRTATPSSPSSRARSRRAGRPCSTPPRERVMLLAVTSPSQPQRRPARLRAGRVPVLRARRRRFPGRPARQRAESVDAARLDPAARRRPGRSAYPRSRRTTPSPTARAARRRSYLIGLRNPWRFSFDRRPGSCGSPTSGQNAYEEVNRGRPGAAAGANLGWNLMEGIALLRVRLLVRRAGAAGGRVRPRLGCSITGGYVYRGSAIDGLARLVPVRRLLQRPPVRRPLRSDVPTEGTRSPPRVLLETGRAVSSLRRGHGRRALPRRPRAVERLPHRRRLS